MILLLNLGNPEIKSLNNTEARTAAFVMIILSAGVYIMGRLGAPTTMVTSSNGRRAVVWLQQLSNQLVCILLVQRELSKAHRSRHIGTHITSHRMLLS
jgi:hypothetical protein